MERTVVEIWRRAIMLAEMLSGSIARSGNDLNGSFLNQGAAIFNKINRNAVPVQPAQLMVLLLINR